MFSSTPCGGKKYDGLLLTWKKSIENIIFEVENTSKYHCLDDESLHNTHDMTHVPCMNNNTHTPLTHKKNTCKFGRVDFITKFRALQLYIQRIWQKNYQFFFKNCMLRNVKKYYLLSMDRK